MATSTAGRVKSFWGKPLASASLVFVFTLCKHLCLFFLAGKSLSYIPFSREDASGRTRLSQVSLFRKEGLRAIFSLSLRDHSAAAEGEAIRVGFSFCHSSPVSPCWVNSSGNPAIKVNKKTWIPCQARNGMVVQERGK